jgi:putative membrane protein
MNRFVIRWIINAIALYVAVALVGGIEPQSENWLSYLGMALVFGVVNALFGPVLKLLTCPLILLTLGLFTLVINTFLFWLVGWIGSRFGVGFTVDSLWSAFLGSIVVSLVSVILSLFLRDEAKNDRH